MTFDLLIQNLVSPTLLFFVLGIISAKLKSDLKIPDTCSIFLSIYLLFSIGFNGGQELSHSNLSTDVMSTIIFSILSSLIIPIYVFFVIKNKFGIYNAGAIAASYGSVSAVTFITAISFLESSSINFGGHMIACLAFMEVPAILVGVFMVKYFSKNKNTLNLKATLKQSLTNGSVVLIIGSLLIGYFTNEKIAMDIKPFTKDIFKGFLILFLLDMGIKSGNKLKSFFKNGFSFAFYAILFSFVNGCLSAFLSIFFIEDIGNRFLFSVLISSASYIAVPAAMKLSIPKSNEGIYLPMALAISFPFNITLGFPLYFYICSYI